eukprot:TRINITY_DN33198_c0_g1_i1.p1 TRINITY_DN33198_c0_g1~~TRINITY_DN33198_c0_g1_i1.p1  ORF type:complete len:114 (-),score=9.40 TRINITY_DN33198_c0_g1_i1:193-534(-)
MRHSRSKISNAANLNLMNDRFHPINQCLFRLSSVLIVLNQKSRISGEWKVKNTNKNRNLLEFSSVNKTAPRFVQSGWRTLLFGPNSFSWNLQTQEAPARTLLNVEGKGKQGLK